MALATNQGVEKSSDLTVDDLAARLCRALRRPRAAVMTRWSGGGLAIEAPSLPDLARVIDYAKKCG